MDRVQGAVGKAGIETGSDRPKDPRKDLARERVRAYDGVLPVARTRLRGIHSGFHLRQSGRPSMTAARTTRVHRLLGAGQILAEPAESRKLGMTL
jgi:hypothetical protein